MGLVLRQTDLRLTASHKVTLTQLDGWSNGLGSRPLAPSNVSRRGHSWDLLPWNDR
jgi:hypothetical protein